MAGSVGKVLRLTSGLIRCDDDIGGDKKGTIFCRRDHIIRHVPDSSIQDLYKENAEFQLILDMVMYHIRIHA